MNQNNNDLLIDREGNDIYFYEEVNSAAAMTLVKILKEVDNKNVWFATTHDCADLPPIKLHLNTIGGSVFSAVAIADTILTLRSKIITIIEGNCSSAGTIISIVGSRRLMTRNSYILIHQLSGGMEGKHEEMKDAIENYRLIAKKLEDMYLRYTKIPKKEFDKMITHDLYLPAELAKKWKFVDEVI
jgi:ATP-dependent protease ClpP protease subunit